MKLDQPYLLHIRDYLGKIAKVREEGQAAFFADYKLSDVVTVNLVWLGECASKLSDSSRKKCKSIDWESIFSLRELIDIDNPVSRESLWRIMTQDLLPLAACIASCLAESSGIVEASAQSQGKIPDFILEKRAGIYHLAQKYGISNIRVFGSHVRGEERHDSDIDLLVHFDSSATNSGFSFLDFQKEAGDLLNKKVDLVSDGGLSPYIGPYILEEALPL